VEVLLELKTSAFDHSATSPEVTGNQQ